MRWLEDLETKYRSKSSHMFLLHLNVDDPLLKEKQFEEIFDFLSSEPPLKDSQFLAFFNRALGIHFLNQEMEEKFLEFLGRLFPQKSVPGQRDPDAVIRFLQNRRKVSFMFELFYEMLYLGWNDERDGVKKILEQCFPDKVEQGRKNGFPFFSCFLEYVESLVPPDSMHSAVIEDRNSLVTLLGWGKDSFICEARNAVVLIGADIGGVAKELCSDTCGIMPVEVPFLNLDDRFAALKVLEQEFPSTGLGISPERAARISGGLSRRNLIQLTRESLYQGKPLNEEAVFSRKKKHLEDRSGGLAELYRPVWGLEAIGAMEDKKEYILEVVAAMKKGDVLAVPQGILLLGPPGTGKTVFVQALAYEAGIEIAKLKNIRSMWVGESERNQDYILKLLISHQPVIIFADEIDQEFLMRGTFFSGDTGVTQRMQKRFLEMMSDTDLRGKVLWVGASNRPDLIDQAFLREGRFDDVLPFLPYNAEERNKILRAILNKLGRQAEAARAWFEYQLAETFYVEFGELTHGHFKEGEGWLVCTPELHKDRKTEIGFTGGEVEYIITLANRCARREGRPLGEEDLRSEVKNFIPKRNMQLFEASVDIALGHCNSIKFIPRDWQERARRVRGQRSERPVNLSGQYL